MKKTLHIYVALEDVDELRVKKGYAISMITEDHTKAYLERVETRTPQKDEREGLIPAAEYTAIPRQVKFKEDERFKYITSVEVEVDE